MDGTNFYAMLSRMKYIQRWGLMRNQRDENLSEHTLEVALLCHALCAISNTRLGTKLDTGQAVLYAMYHDCSEIITGDLPTPIKYHSDEMKKAYKAVEHGASQRLLSLLPDDLCPQYAPYLEQKPSPELAKILKAADKLSALIKCIEEQSGGNKEFTMARKSTEAALKEMNMPAVDIFMAECLEGYGLTLDEMKL